MSAGVMTDQHDEISKKDVLRETGISYGQFYRWKRMGLIPEQWFRRRSTFTGQEAFLPRDKVLERIRLIQELKDAHSFEEIAEIFSPDPVRQRYRAEEVATIEWLSDEARTVLPRRDPQADFSFLEVLCLGVIQCLLDEGKARKEQILLAADTLAARFGELEDTGTARHLTLVVRDGVTLAVVHGAPCLFDRGSEVVASVDLNELTECIRLHLQEAIG
jgi:DNA-binding transcriptional MerR regulator